MRFAPKNVLVTGAAAGLGRYIARAFASEGADIAILDFEDAGATGREITTLKLNGGNVNHGVAQWEEDHD